MRGHHSWVLIGLMSVGGCSAQSSSDRPYLQGTAGASGAGVDGGLDGSSKDCEGVTCNTPPGSECANEDQLRVHEGKGVCEAGACSYASQLLDCPQGCNANACVGDPCIGVTCTAAPPNACADATHLAVYDVPGTCDEGQCVYTTHNEYCAHGCENGSCTGDPCVGVTCNNPPANYCSSSDKLVVYAATGSCGEGECSYGSHEEHCQHGCSQGSCDGDPCVGVVCASPPADYCSSATTLREHSSGGTCAVGSCNYPYVDSPCAYGCEDGACRQCNVDANCEAGFWCSAGVCKPCNENAHCGPGCTNCTLSSDVCNAGSTACVDCNVDGDCALAGEWCNANVCTVCDTSDHCGVGCVACSATVPVCNSGVCQCTSTSCGAYHTCVGGTCTLCNSGTQCGAACDPCGGSTPYCFSDGSTSSCVECSSDQHCSTDWVCDLVAHVCVDPCAPPLEACTTGTQNRDGWSKARTIGRTQAATTAGYQISDHTCYASDRFDESSGCWDANADHTYRMYLRKDEKIDVILSTGWDCDDGWGWYATFSVYGTTGECLSTTKGSRLFCVDQKTQHTTSYTALADGWYYLIVDGSSAFGDEGDYQFRVNLTCKVPGCECG